MAKEMKVAYQGEVGAYSEEAAAKLFPKATAVPYKYLSEVFEAVARGAVDFGVVPIENSLEGSVGQTYDILLKTKLKVVGETQLRISHCLIANPGAKISGIRRIFSHPQALGQCRAYIEKLGAEPIASYDTAGSVRQLKESGSTDAAAIAGERAAKIYGMQILARDIQSNKANYTRFFVVSRKEAPRAGAKKTSIIISLKHKPGSLYGALRAFADQKINLTKLESRPIYGTSWEYYFYLDFEGHQLDNRVKKALSALKKSATSVKILGSYPVKK